MRNTRPVYATGPGDLRARDSRPERDPPLPPSGRGRAPSNPPDDGIVRIFRERAGRGGKTVTVVRGLPERGATLDARAAELKQLCGAGGTVKDGAVLIQGDHRERVADRLRAQGYTVKLAGG
jgi:translation initiation factor 1